MVRDFGPWVRQDWCPTCVTWTEQTRWHSFVARGSALNGLKVRCNDCYVAVPVPSRARQEDEAPRASDGLFGVPG